MARHRSLFVQTKIAVTQRIVLPSPLPGRGEGLDRQVSIDKETGNAVGDALSAANRWEVVQKGSQESAFVTLGRRVAAPL